MWKFSHTIKNVFFLTNRKEPLHWPISPSSCKFFFSEHSITVLYAKPVKLIKEHINFLYFTTSFNMIPTMVLKQVPDKFCMSEVFPELKTWNFENVFYSCLLLFTFVNIKYRWLQLARSCLGWKRRVWWSKVVCRPAKIFLNTKSSFQ